MGESPEQTDLIRQGYWYGGQNSPIRESRTTISLDVVHPEVKKLFFKCFNEGHTQPHLRPTAQDWHNALEVGVNELTVCGSVDSHHYSRHYGKCYWCERAANLGVDIFPGVAGAAKVPSPTKQPSPPPQVPSRYRKQTVSSSPNKSSKKATSGYSNNSPSTAVPSVPTPKSLSQSTLPSSKTSTTKKVSTQKPSVKSPNSGLRQQIINTKSSLYKRRKFLKIAGISIAILATGIFTPKIYKLLNPILVSSPNNKKSRYGTINKAIKNAEPNSKIKVPPGIYREGLIIDKPVEIVGDGLREEIIIESADSDCILMQTDSAVVRGLTLKCKAGENGKKFFGINIPQGKLIVEDLDITSDSLACIVIQNSETNPIIRKCRIYDGKGKGIYVHENGKGIIEDCDIYGNTDSGVAIKTGGSPVLRRCLFEFEVVTVNNQGRWIERKKNKAEYFIENLGNGVTLDMVTIPRGTFMMGSPDSEKDRRDYESPQHRVTVPAFYMGKFPLTQAQWRAIASLPKINRDLNINPSYFKGDDLPVEQVSWEDAEEFCLRLSKQTGRKYRLPSEAEWEYACRAGTTTPFHFGETITGELANYDAYYTYANEPKKEYREKTTPVGSFPPNAYGLYDMHGNVWEWCEDNWHSNYEGAPTNGSAWLSTANNKKVFRSCSWYIYPYRCRSADRNYYSREYRDKKGGFRVVCVASMT